MRTAELLCLAGLFALGACAQKKPASISRGALEFDVSIRPDPPTTGENHLLLSVKDAAGKPVEGAQIDFLYDMPAMGAMPEMKGGGTVSDLGGGAYDITYPLSMLGDWTLSLEVRAPGHPATPLRLKVSPPRKGFKLEGAGARSPQAGVLEIPPERQQLIGVTYGVVERRPLSLTLRAPGRVEVDESQLAEVTLKYDAYVEKVFASQTGQAVRKGERLLTLYSPELLAAEQDFLLATRNAKAGTPGAKELEHAAREKLGLWSLTGAQLDALERSGKAEPRVTIFSPASGVVLEKNVVEGTRVMAGNTLYKIGNLGRIWVIADLYEWDAPYVAVGQRAKMSVPARSGQAWDGEVQFIYPTIEPRTRALQVRLAFSNPGLALKPGMFVDVSVEVPLGEKLAVPDRALLVSGEHRYAFVQTAPGRLRPVEVKVGAMTPDYDEVLSGLDAGDQVATNATFLLSSEAQLRDALPRWSAP